MDPFAFNERDGYFYGRGTSDDKAQAAIWIANLIRLRAEGYQPDRDIIVALTADEEGGPENGVAWLLENHRPLIDAAYCLNEGGDGQIKGGKYLLNEIQPSEKIYTTFQLEVTNPGGHSSLPVKDNAIYQLAAGLNRLAAFDFPIELNEVTRAFFDRTAALTGGQAGADMKAVAAIRPDLKAAERLAAGSATFNAQLRTTCVATQLEGGHAENALPQMARAVVNCRMLPGSSQEAVRSTLVKVLDDRIAVTAIWQAVASPPSPLSKEVMTAVEGITQAMWPGVPVVPTMATGATDGLYLRNAGIPTYGISGIFYDVDDVRAHGRDERVGVKQFHEGREFLYRLVKALSTS
jgi:acetylornithine deacetylase/succinyl-diaminopimelate desuccinylase-like protein